MTTTVSIYLEDLVRGETMEIALLLIIARVTAVGTGHPNLIRGNMNSLSMNMLVIIRFAAY